MEQNRTEQSRAEQSRPEQIRSSILKMLKMFNLEPLMMDDDDHETS
jgi:hypothetical protein